MEWKHKWEQHPSGVAGERICSACGLQSGSPQETVALENTNACVPDEPMPDNTPAPVTAADIDKIINDTDEQLRLGAIAPHGPGMRNLAYALRTARAELAAANARLAALDEAAKGDAVEAVMESVDNLHYDYYNALRGEGVGHRTDGWKDVEQTKASIRTAIAALVARADAEAERAERAEEAVVALLNRVLIYHDSEIDAGFFQCVDCCRTVSVRNVSFGSCGEEIEHSISCDVADTLREHAAAIAAARGRVREVRDAD